MTITRHDILGRVGWYSEEVGSKPQGFLCCFVFAHLGPNDFPKDRFVKVALFFEGFNPDCKHDKSDASFEFLLRNVSSDLWYQILVTDSTFSCDPRMFKGFLSRSSSLRIRLEQRQYEILARLGNILPVSVMENDSATSTFLDHVCKIFRPPGRVAAEQGVGDDAQRPHISGFAMALLEHDLGRSVAEKSGHIIQLFVTRDKLDAVEPN